LLVACTSEDESASVSIPDDAVPAGTEAVSTEALYRLPVGDDGAVLIRVRGEELSLAVGSLSREI
jgi:hypothetical protein